MYFEFSQAANPNTTKSVFFQLVLLYSTQNIIKNWLINHWRHLVIVYIVFTFKNDFLFISQDRLHTHLVVLARDGAAYSSSSSWWRTRDFRVSSRQSMAMSSELVLLSSILWLLACKSMKRFLITPFFC